MTDLYARVASQRWTSSEFSDSPAIEGWTPACLPADRECGVTNFTQADIDEMRGAAWMKSLGLPEHAAIPTAVNPRGTMFRARCGCGWYGEVWAAGPGAKARAQKDADEHQALYAEKEIA